MTTPGRLALCPDCTHHIDVHNNSGCQSQACDCDLIRQGVVAKRVYLEVAAALTSTTKDD